MLYLFLPIRLYKNEFSTGLTGVERAVFLMQLLCNNSQNVICYTENGFGKEEQIRLAKVYKELADKGCYVMLSNHNTTLVKELYKDFNIHVIEAKRNINSNGNKRGKVEEVIITNYNNKEGFE